MPSRHFLRILTVLAIAGGCGARSGIHAPDPSATATDDTGVPDVTGRDVAAQDIPDAVAHDAVDVNNDTPERPCTWRIAREARIDVGQDLFVWPPTGVFGASSGAEVWLGVNVGTRSRILQLQRVGFDGAPVVSPIQISSTPPSGRWLSKVSIAIDPPRRALIHAEQGAGCSFVRFEADGTLAVPIAVGLDHCFQLRVTPTGYTLWGAADTASADQRMTIDNAGVITRRTTFPLPMGARRLADMNLADGGILIVWTPAGTPPSNTLHIQRFSVDGGPTEPESTIVGPAGTQVWGLEIAPTADGFVATWTQAIDAFGSGPVLLARLDERGTPRAAPRSIGTQTHRTTAGGPTLAVSHGYALVSWHEIDTVGAARIVMQPVPLGGGALPPSLALLAPLDPTPGFQPIQIVSTQPGALLTAWVAATPMSLTTEIVAFACD